MDLRLTKTDLTLIEAILSAFWNITVGNPAIEIDYQEKQFRFLL